MADSLQFRIENNRFTTPLVVHRETPKYGILKKPIFIVLHYTASWNYESTVTYLCDSAKQVSCHLVLGRNGQVTQLAPFDKSTWHADGSYYAGYRWLNGYSIGIELMNIGWLKATEDYKFMDPYGTVYDEDQLKKPHMLNNRFSLIASEHPRLGNGIYHWPAYPKPQLDALNDIIDALLIEYPTIKYIVSHEEIDTRGWKTDPGPAFPIRRFQKLLEGRNDKVDEWRVATRGSKLNVRGGPGTTFEVVASLLDRDIVSVIKREGDWFYIEANGHVGYVFSRYLVDIEDED